MAFLDPEEAHRHFQEKVLEGIKSTFPVKGRMQSVHLENLEVRDTLKHDDVSSQYDAKVGDKTWSVPVYANLVLTNNADGAVVDKRKVRVADIPKITNRHSYIVDGQEYQIDNQWQLKPGVYARRKANGELEARFNVTGKPTFNVHFDPPTKQFTINYNKMNLPLMPFLQAQGVDKAKLEKMWGKEILEANEKARGSVGALDRWYRSVARKEPGVGEAAQHLDQVFQASQLRPDSTKVTLGKEYSHVNGDALADATRRLIEVHHGGPEDDRDSLLFKDIRSGGDFVFDKMKNAQRTVQTKIQRKLGTATDLRKVIRLDHFQSPIRSTFIDNAATRVANQINPVEMLASASQTTVLGPGGIQSEQKVTEDAKYINASHYGFLDGIVTPESCFDPETEVYTSEGWKFWPEVDERTLFACKVGGRLEFHAATELTRQHYKGLLYGVNQPQFAYLVTGNHRMWCRPMRMLDSGKPAYRIVRAEDMHGKRRVFTSTHEATVGTKEKFFYLPFVAGNNSSKNVSKIALKDWAEFLGWYLTEGHTEYTEHCVNGSNRRSNYKTGISQSEVNPEYCRKIEALLKRLPFSWSVTTTEGKNVYVISTKQLAHYTRQFGYSHERFLPEEVHTWPEDCRKVLLKSLLLGDGRLTYDHQRTNHHTQDSRTFTTTSPRLAKDVERLCVSLGLPVTPHVYTDQRGFRDVYELCLLKHKERQVSHIAGKVSPYYTTEYAGLVYCATVPGSLMYVRRNKKRPVWLGNSRTGVTLRLPLGVKREGNQLKIGVYDVHAKKHTDISIQDFHAGNVVLADQVDWKDGKPVPKFAKVQMAGAGNEFSEKPFSQARYVLANPIQTFSLTSNMIPFLANTNGNRAGMSARHIEQAISLKDREAPLVQVGTGSSVPGQDTFEGTMGRWSAQVAPVNGVVTRVGKEGITVKGGDGKSHTVTTYHHYPLNDTKSMLHSEPLVKAGDTVKKNQVLADTNYSRGGVLAQGTNLRIGYIPFKGLNYEDAFVLSESAAKKLSSVHLHKHEVNVTPDLVMSRTKFEVEHPTVFTKKQLELVGTDGVVPIGTKVKPGDPLILAMTPYQIKDRVGLNQIRRSVSGAHTDRSVRWDGNTEGEVVAVHHTPKGIKVHVKSFEPMQVADKLSSRSANKGVVGAIIPDHEMPRTADGQHIEIAMNPTGLPGRMNMNQVYETLASKIAKKTGKPYIIHNFNDTTNAWQTISDDLKKHGISDTEILHDPVSGQVLGPALVGYQHMLKLTHQVDKKMAVRSGMELPGLHSGESYDVNLQPSKGGHSGGQSIGSLGMYALLAHGVPNVVREIQTIKSEGPDPQSNESKRWPSQHMAVWQAIQTGAPIPVPKPTFAFHKFVDMLKGSGINVEKEGHEYVLSPLTNKNILSMSKGAIPKPTLTVHAKLKDGELMPETGGLFDPKLTGGHGGRSWNHMKLSEPVPNPVFEAPIVSLLGMKRSDYYDVVKGIKGISTTNGSLTSPDKGLVGGAAISHLLNKIDVKKELNETKALLDKTPIHKVDPLVKKVKYLRSLDKLGMKPSEAYVLDHVPIMPAIMRPVSLLPQGDVKRADINELYAQLAMANERLGDKKAQENLPEASRQALRGTYYDAVKAIAGVGVPYANQEHKGLLHQIAGPYPKAGMVQKTLLSKKQDLSARGVVTPGQDLGLDEVGLPRGMATTLFRPFLVKKLVDNGEAPNPLMAQQMLARAEKGESVPAVHRALDAVALERPVMIKRDPALHKFSVMGFTAKVHNGPDIKVHPLVVGGMSMDFDGDTSSIYVPIGKEAVEETHRMKPSNNLFSEATGRLMNVPTLDSALGLYKLSLVGKKSGQTVNNYAAALHAVKDKKLGLNDLVHIKDKNIDTTAGRVIMATGLPEDMQKSVLQDHSKLWDKKGLNAAFTQLAKEHPKEFALHANRLKDIGFGTTFGAVGVIPSDTMGIKALDPKNQFYVPTGIHSFSLKDLEPDTQLRNKHLATARKEVEAINAGSGSKSVKDAKSIQTWQGAEERIKNEHLKKMEHTGSNLFTMLKAGTKPSWDQYKQIVLAPMLVNDSKDRPIVNPVTKSYSEGLDMAGYWQQMYGARRGTAKKVLEVQGPGALTKLLMSNTIDSVVTNHDCGTTRGISLPVANHDVIDRHLAAPVKSGVLDLKVGTLLTPEIVGKLRATNAGHVLVRSALKCEEPKGLCQVCLGNSVSGHHHPIGQNVGVQATQTLGERSVQLTLRSFHSGSVAAASTAAAALSDASAFKRLEQLTKLPEVVAGSASLAMRGGKVERIEKDSTGAKVWIGGVPHHVGLDRNGAPLYNALPGVTSAWTAPKVGMHMDAGAPLSDPSRTVINPRDLYTATGSMEKVQNHLTDQIHKLYESEGVKRKNVEILVKSMSNLTRIHDPGDQPDLLRGEFRPTSVIDRINRDLRAHKKNPIQHSPVLKGVDLLPHDMQEDWMAKLMHKKLRTTVEQGAATLARSDVHSSHPVPGLIYGAEFGMNEQHSKMPNMGHLKNVKPYHY